MIETEIKYTKIILVISKCNYFTDPRMLKLKAIAYK